MQYSEMAKESTCGRETLRFQETEDQISELGMHVYLTETKHGWVSLWFHYKTGRTNCLMNS